MVRIEVDWVGEPPLNHRATRFQLAECAFFAVSKCRTKHKSAARTCPPYTENTKHPSQVSRHAFPKDVFTSSIPSLIISLTKDVATLCGMEYIGRPTSKPQNL